MSRKIGAARVSKRFFLGYDRFKLRRRARLLAVFFIRMDSAQCFRKLARSMKERENHDLLFADLIDQPVMLNEEFPHGRIADLRNSASPLRKSPQ